MSESHSQRAEQAISSLEGLALGDAFGRSIWDQALPLEQIQRERSLATQTWRYTDDTEMAISIVQTLIEHQHIEQSRLAELFAQRFIANEKRGYGAVSYWILHQLHQGRPWKEASTEPYGGEGSKGNGAAMRVAPVGAYFYDDLEKVKEQASLSAEVTHAHIDGQAGAIAVAIATALAQQWREHPTEHPFEYFEEVISYLPDSETKDKVVEAKSLVGLTPKEAGKRLGTGIRVLSSDTAPLALWCSLQHLGHYENAMWCVIDSLTNMDADIDTLCAMVGGIVGASLGPGTLPPQWLDMQEKLDRPWVVEKEK